MRKHKVKISPNYAVVEHSNFSMPGRLRFEDRVASFIDDRFYAENVDVPDEVLKDVARAFMADAPTLIDLIADGDVAAIDKYMDDTFPSTVLPQKRRRRKR